MTAQRERLSLPTRLPPSDDPYLARWQPAVGSIGDLVPRVAWQAEALKRQVSLDSDRPDIATMTTWWWQDAMLAELDAMPTPVPSADDALPLRLPAGVAGWHCFMSEAAMTSLHGSDLPPAAIYYDDGSVEVPDTDEFGPTMRWRRARDITPHAKAAALLRQRIVGVQRRYMPRSDRRRQGLPPVIDDSGVIVVTLRAPEPEFYHYTSPPDSIERDKHWWVRGHWRRQPYLSRDATELIWIPTHLRGNLDAPLFAPPRVHKVSR